MGRPRSTHCPKGHELSGDNLYVSPKGHRACKACKLVTTRRSQKKNSTLILERKKTRRLHHRVPSESPESKRGTRLRAIGWTQELFDSTLLEQNNKCAICDKEMNLELRQNDARACADHEHCVPPKPRGVLCTNCNLGIGNLQDSSEILVKALAYVRRYENGTCDNAGGGDI